MKFPSNLLIVVFLIVVIWILNVDYEIWTHFWKRMFGLRNSNYLVFDNTNTISVTCNTPKLVLYGIFSTAQSLKMRSVVRSKTKCDFHNENYSTVFVIGKPENENDYKQLRGESILYKDIFVLKASENMNDGKSFEYFRQAVHDFPCFDYYAKVDDDTAFNPKTIATFVSENMYKNSYMGRKSVNEDYTWYKIWRKAFYFRKNMDWLRNLEFYHAGFLYILDKHIIQQWTQQRPVLYGDEDMRTALYMKYLNATVIDFNTHFHELFVQSFVKSFERQFSFIKTYTDSISDIKGNTGPWERHISNDSWAVHKCKDPATLSSVFNQLCQ